MHSKSRKVRAAVFFGVLFALVFLVWVGNQIVTGQEEQRVHIFPTQIDSQGWDRVQAAYQQTLSPEAVVTDFTTHNTAYVQWGDVEKYLQPLVVPKVEVIDTSENIEGAQTDIEEAENIDAEPDAVPEDANDIVSEETQVLEEETAVEEFVSDEPINSNNGEVTGGEEETQTDNIEAGDVPADEPVAEDASPEEVVEEVVDESVDQTEQSSEAETVGMMDVFKHLIVREVFAQETTESSTPTVPEGVVDVAEEIPFVCLLDNSTCYTMVFSGFGIDGALSQNELAHATVKVSFATLAEDNVLANDRLRLMYAIDGAWQVAGEVVIDGVSSNKERGGYQEFFLPDVEAWEDLEDLQFALEYDRKDDTAAGLYLDALWVDVTYKGKEDGYANTNVSEELQIKDESRLLDVLVLNKDQKLTFDYTDENSLETLILKTERASYAALGDGQTIYFNVTNTGTKAESFTLQFYNQLDGQTKLPLLQKWYRNVPQEVSTVEYGDTAYFCGSMWKQTASSSPEYICEETQEVLVCDSLNAEENNCIVENQEVGVNTSVAYVDEFKDVSVVLGGVDKKYDGKAIPSDYAARFKTAQAENIAPGQTLYFAISADLHANDNRFYIEAVGNSGYGLVGPNRKYVSIYDQQGITKTEEEAEDINANLYFKKDLQASDDLSFSFKYKSQKGFLSRLFTGGELGDFKIKKIIVTYAGGKSFEVAPESVVYGQNGEWSISLNDKRSLLTPGKYTLEVEVEEGKDVYVDTRSFYWGVLAVNTNKSVYVANETAYIQMGVLSNTGSTICNADLQLMLTDPHGNTQEIPVTESGECMGNNVTDVPDYYAYADLGLTGIYDIELVHYGEDGSILHSIVDSFEVRNDVAFDVERTGPTRIYPLAAYDVTIDIGAQKDFSGDIVEVLPLGFEVTNTNADSVVETDSAIVVTWSQELLQGETLGLYYTFDAPDISPYLYTLGPLQLVEGAEIVFEEVRQWQIASDATGNMLIFWEGATDPVGWTCVSCTGGDAFFQNFIVGSSTYGGTGGSANHTHTVSESLYTSSQGATENKSGSTISITAHAHTFTATMGTGSNLPSYRQLKVLQYDTPGEPTELPTGAIVIFDTTVPSGWTQLSAQNGYFVRGENTAGSPSGSNTHTHSISGTTGAATGGTVAPRGGGANTGADAGHTHTVSTTTPAVDQQPPYLEVIFASLDATTTPPNGIITMWTDDPDTGWSRVSDSGGDFSGNFIKGSSSYGTTGGSATHSHSNVTGIISNQTGTVSTNLRSGTAGSDGAHTHQVDITSFSTESNLPPYVNAIFAKRQGAATPVFTQNYYHWYVNVNSQTPTDPWPSGAVDLLENEAITAAVGTVSPGDEVRLRISATVSNATTTATTSPFKLQFGEMNTACADIAPGAWFDVGQLASTTIWRGFDNGAVTDGSALASTTLSVTTVAGSYEETNNATTTPTAYPDDDIEYDWVLYNNNATSTTNYCFRMVQADDTVFDSYTRYPTLETNYAPEIPTLSKLFDNEKVASSSPWFEFYTTDNEGERVDYQIQVSTDYNFATTSIDRNSDDNDNLFKNTVDGLDKAPFIQNNLIRFKPTTSLSAGTYWWRVRAIDPNGSNSWGEWSEKWSFTVDSGTIITTWYQTTEEQFDKDTLVNVDALATDEVALATGSSTGSLYGQAIDFDWTDQGTIWGSFYFNDTEGTGDIKYYIEYLSGTSTWGLVEDSYLSGNSSGFDTGTTTLSGLDTDLHNVIRVRADFNEVVSGNPTLQDWTVEWGTRVETPTLTKLFDNEKMSTTTPTFEFYTTDPQDEDVTYQISWSDSYDFTSSTTKTSDTDIGFIDITSADTDPFTSGDVITYTIQSGDALTDGNTYWWRVRAIDPTPGGNSWSLWSDPRSFTVDASTTSSTWFQTTAEQFDTDILTGLTTIGTSSVTVATSTGDALIAYAEGSVQTPRYRLWDADTLSWGSELSAQSVGAQIYWIALKAGVTRDEYALATLGADTDVNVQIYSDGAWGDLQEITAAIGNVGARGFDITYESVSGNLMAVACDGDDDPTYYTWDGSGWTGPGTITTTGTGNCEWVRLASDPVSNEIIVLTRNSAGSAYEALVWNGSTWANSVTLGSMSDLGHEGMAVEYEESGGQAIVVTSDGNPPRFVWNTWNGTSWDFGTPQTQSIGNDLEWASLKRDDGSDAMVLCYVDQDNDIGAVRWSGTAWTDLGEIETAGITNNDRPVDCEFETTSGRDGYVLQAYSDATNARYQYWNGSTWSAEGSVSTITSAETVQLRRTGDGTVLGVFFDGANTQYDFSYWIASTTSWSTAQTLEDTSSVTVSPYHEPFMIAPKNPQSSGSLLSSAIDFDDGLGPFWFEASWNDVTNGSSDILYQVQYYNTASSTWDLVPDSFIPGNSVGTTTSPIDLSNLSITAHNQIRLKGNFTCVSGTCPILDDWTVEWAEGITISGTAEQYDQATPVADGRTVAIAVNGVLQSGKTGTTASGNWSIPNVTVFEGDVVTVFITGVADTNEAVAVAKYSGGNSMTGIELFERHLSIGSDDDQIITNSDLSSYDSSVSGSDDIFFDVVNATNDLFATTTGTTFDVELYVQTGDTYRPDSTSSGNVTVHDIEINGQFIADANTVNVSGSWDNNGGFNSGASTVVFNATSTTETIDSTGAATSTFYNVTFGDATSAAATWDLVTDIDINGNTTIAYGTVSQGTSDLALAGNLLISTDSGLFAKGTGTTTFDGSVTRSWTDSNTTKQDMGIVVIDGSLKTVQLGSDVKATDIVIGSDDALDVTISNHGIEVTGDWYNNSSFIARQGTVTFTSTTTSRSIFIGSSSFYNLTFNGSGGEWTFQDTSATIGNDLTITTGSVILPTATTTISGSLSNSGTFTHAIGTMLFNAGATGETIDVGTSTMYNVTFDNAAGGWTFTSNATTTNNFRINSGEVTLPTNLSVDGSFNNIGGTFVSGSGTVNMTSVLTGETVRAGSSSFYNLTFNGSGGEWTFQDTSATIGNDLTITTGSVILPTATTTISGSLSNSGTFTHAIGTMLFNAGATGETIDVGTSTMYNVTFDNAAGGWTLLGSATSTNNWNLLDVADFTAPSGGTIEVQGEFTNDVDGNNTTWDGSTLFLNSGTTYAINTKTALEDRYDTLSIGSSTDISMWNASATTTVVDASGSLYSQDHDAVYGDLYIWGDYHRTSGTEYWSYNTDFDGTDISGSPRQVDVWIADGATTTIETGATLEILGTATSTTAIDSLAGTYAVVLSGATINAQYYSFRYLNTSGLQLLASTTVTSLDDGDFELAALSDGGTLMTVASSTIDTNPLLQIYNVRFATSTGVTGGSNVTQTEVGASSYWWFRDTTGNYDGENFDNDTGNPGSIRWDDSNLTITVSGVVYDNDESTPLGGPTCDGSTPVVRLKVNGLGNYFVSCSATSSYYEIPLVTYNGDVVLTTYLDGAAGGEMAVAVTRTPTGDVTNMDLYADKVIVRHEDTGVLDISHMAVYDSSDDSDIPFTATTSLTVYPEHELHVWSGKTFTPGGDVTLTPGGSGASHDGTLHVDDSSSFVAAGTQTHSIGGSWTLDTGATFTAASSTVVFTATSTGKSIQPQSSDFNEVVFNGGGEWSIDGNTVVNNDVTISSGTIVGANDLTIYGGDLTGDGDIAMTGGTVMLDGSGSFGGATDWSFSSLSFGDGSGVSTTTKTGVNSIATGVMTVDTSHTLLASDSTWELAGGGTPFVINGIFDAETSTFQYTSTASTNVTPETYYDLELAAAGAGSPTYTMLLGSFVIGNNFTVGDGVNNTTVTANASDPSLDVAGDVIIASGSTFEGSNVSAFNVAGSWVNSGTYTHGSGTVTFDSADTGETLTVGGSPFYTVVFDNSAGGWTVLDNATSTNNWTLSNATAFTATSSTVIEVGGNFTNDVGGAATTWTDSTLYINSGTSQTINSTSTADAYGTLQVGPSTQVRMWNSTSSVYTIDPTGSLYSQDHNGTDGDLYIWGNYTRASGADYWSYDVDFDGADISGSPRRVWVYMADNATTTITGGSLYINGDATATTTIDAQGSGTYSLTINGGNINAQYYSLKNMNATGLRLLGSSAVTELSDGDFELAVNGGDLITVAGSVINANPLKTFFRNRFATSTGVTTGENVYVTSASVSSWRFTQHYGGLDGELYDNDPSGNPGLVVWDDSANSITISGYVYSDEAGTVSGVCDDSTPVVRLKVEGAGNDIVSCSSADGSYSITGVDYYLTGDRMIVFLDGASGGEKAANVSVDPFTNIGDMNLYENRVVVRHEDSNPLSIADMAVYDSDLDADIPFDAATSTTDTLVVDAGTKLIIWDNKTFVPDGNVTLTSGGSSDDWDGTLAIHDGATFSAAGTQSHSIGGSWIASSTATFVPSASTVTFTSTASGKDILMSGSAFNNVIFNGVGGSWTIQDTNATTTNNVTITNGSVTLPSGTFAVGGSFDNNGGSFTHSSGEVLFTSIGAETVTASSSDFYDMTFDGVGGSWTIQDTNATTTNNVTITNGSVTLPIGTFAVGGSFDNNGGSFTHSSGEVLFTSTATSTTITASSSPFYDMTFDGIGGEWTFQDLNASSSHDVTIQNGIVYLPTGTMEIGGSLVNNDIFSHPIGTLLFNSTSLGNTVSVGTSSVFNIEFNNASGGWTISGSATSTNDWALTNASSYTVASSTTIEVQGEFTNNLLGTNTTWDGSTLYLNSASAYSINSKSAGGDEYNILQLGADMDISMWNSRATTTTVASSSSLYSQDHGVQDGDLYIWGDLTVATSTYWSYATDFDGAALVGGARRQVNVLFAANATTTMSSNSLEIVGDIALPTTIDNQGSGTYSINISGGTINADYYQFRNMNSNGLYLTGSPTVTSLSNGDFQLAVDGGSMITVSSTTVDANPSQTITSTAFATSTGIASGYNVYLIGSTTNSWTFTGHSGNYDGEDYDFDGVDGCGQIRWDDSSCLFVNQAHYRWRNDDGGEGVPASQWFDADWSRRQAIRITDTSGSALTDHQVKVVIPYDSDMQSNFGDLRFTDSSGTTTIDYWIESYVSLSSSTVWIKVPSVPANGSTDVYMYYDNVGTVATDGVATSTFVFFDDFEDGDISEYSGDTTYFEADTSFAYQGTYGLGATTGNENQETIDGIYRTGTSSTVSQGETIRFYQYIDTTAGSNDEPCMLFGVQTPGTLHDNYAVCLDTYDGEISISKDVYSDNDSGTDLAVKSVTWATGWYEVEVDWVDTNDIDVTVYNSSGAVFATTTATSSAYTSGGIGFSFFSQFAGWDYVTSQAYAASDPIYNLGIEQQNGGATWKAAEDEPLINQRTSENVRLRFSIQNTGPDITAQNFRLQYAEKGAYNNCLSVPYGNYGDVPTTTGGCGTDAACMVTSAQFANQASTTQLMTVPTGLTFSQGKIMEDPSNQTNSIDVLENNVTEVEYNFELTSYATSSAYCFRVVDGTEALENYAQNALVQVLHAPDIKTFTFHADDTQGIDLTEGTTRTVYATGTVQDLNGCDDFAYATSTFYRSLVAGGSNCADDPNNCYQIASSSCSFGTCSGGNLSEFTCSADLWYFADPTDDISDISGQSWLAYITISDDSGNLDSSTSIGIDVNTLYALDVVGDIDYGTLSVGSTTPTNATTSLQNTGNDNIDIDVFGTDLVSAGGSITADNQLYATSSFSYSGCSICTLLSGTSTTYDINLAKPTSTSTPITSTLYWGLYVPPNSAGLDYSGLNEFTAVSDN